jgi:hypothetical protein
MGYFGPLQSRKRGEAREAPPRLLLPAAGLAVHFATTLFPSAFSLRGVCFNFRFYIPKEEVEAETNGASVSHPHIIIDNPFVDNNTRTISLS